MNADKSVSAFPDGDNLFSWKGSIQGAAGTVYEGLVYKLTFSFPSNYPFAAPTVKFETPCYHPNVDQYGNICLDILKDQWSALYDVRTVLISLQSLLGEPNIASPLNGHAAALWANQEECVCRPRRLSAPPYVATNPPLGRRYKKHLLQHFELEAAKAAK